MTDQPIVRRLDKVNIWNVSSLGKAADWLRGKAWLGNTDENEVSIAPEP